MAVKYGQKARECMINELEKVFSENKGFLFSNFDHINAVDMTIFRKKAKKAGVKHIIVKKNLGRIAMERAKITGLDDVFDETKNIGVTIMGNDPVVCAKLLKDFGKENVNFAVKAGYLEGRVLDKNKIKELADLPGRQELLTKLVCTINAPVSGFVFILSGLLKNFCYALNAIKDKKGNSST